MNPTQSCTRDVVVSLENGLHLTPSSQIVQLAQKFSCQLLIRKGERVADGKSMLDLMQLAAEHGETLRLEAQGDDATDAIAAIARLFEQNFQSERSD
ncbi:MAG TPA: HPr family phosphocarrier protein [Planctomycetaceae bacterium]|nr:HPr family phosphocarrier protein [Planctomycetaceae bacterium]